MARVDLYQKVTDLIVAELEKGVAPWVRPWKSLGGAAGGLPFNGYTSRPYRGVNVWILVVTAADRGFDDPRWFTFRQTSLLGAHVRKGEKATLVSFWRDLTVEDNDATTGVRKEKRVPLLRAYPVFNAAQCEGVPTLPQAELPAPTELTAELDAMLTRTGASVSHGGDQACYVPSADRIQMPPRVAFVSDAHYWSTLLHELAHWTGHSSRLDRDVTQRFGTLGYAAEELVAELGAAFLCASLGLEGDLRHPEYLASWLRAFREDKRALFRASSLAQRASDFVLGTQQPPKALAETPPAEHVSDDQ